MTRGGRLTGILTVSDLLDLRGKGAGRRIAPARYGDRRRAMLEDIAILTGGRLLSGELGIKLANVVESDLGKAKRIMVDKDSTTIIGGGGAKAAIEGRATALENAVAGILLLTEATLTETLMTIRHSLRIAVILLAALMLPASLARAQSSCAGCHYANPTAPAPDHLADWERSAHGRNNVGCEKCHGGDASSYEPFLAHRGVVHSSNPSSPVHPRNLPATCGRCHTGPFVRFQNSHHFTLLKTGDTRGPTCSTCHDSVGSRLPSPKLLEANCQRCHGPKAIAPRVERAAAARTLLEEVRDSRELLQAARPLIDRMRNKTRQAELRQAYQQAEVPLIEAGRSVHEFVFDTLKERLMTARQRIEALLSALANPEGTTKGR